jgi:hypothetical protein
VYHKQSKTFYSLLSSRIEESFKDMSTFLLAFNAFNVANIFTEQTVLYKNKKDLMTIIYQCHFCRYYEVFFMMFYELKE